jgi:hypothetical protein
VRGLEVVRAGEDVEEPGGYFVGCAVALNAPWSARTSTLTARILPSRVAAIEPFMW